MPRRAPGGAPGTNGPRSKMASMPAPIPAPAAPKISAPTIAGPVQLDCSRSGASRNASPMPHPTAPANSPKTPPTASPISAPFFNESRCGLGCGPCGVRDNAGAWRSAVAKGLASCRAAAGCETGIVDSNATRATQAASGMTSPAEQSADPAGDDRMRRDGRMDAVPEQVLVRLLRRERRDVWSEARRRDVGHAERRRAVGDLVDEGKRIERNDLNARQPGELSQEEGQVRVVALADEGGKRRHARSGPFDRRGAADIRRIPDQESA